ncbi:YfaP family protein [Parasedimentitalea psychrophila]|uniref:DUF4424 domain-containing protein n=1 Tax=Parasedimentitalea psychrophila TaxID=2997337 RepID=A0A9Y2KWZ0_9RHOB|nr:hypothetical protein [Parasedimentitalea psychrophila]WIY24208.1 hypothetical protein QPJ95_16600 [Parasedimentitalea psychrophila]
MAVRKLIAATFALACPLGAAAFEGEQRDLRLIAESTHGASIAVDYDVKWKLSSLMGEPTRNLKIRWRLPRTAAIRLPNDPDYEGAPSNFLVRNLPPDVQDTIRLYDVNVPIGFSGHEAGYDCSSLYAINVIAEGYVTFDAGAPAKPGDKWSYNVTGSPNWAQFMTDFQGKSLSEGTAKSVMSTPNLCGDVQDTQVTGKIALGEALRWIRKSFDKRSIAEMIAGAQRQLEVLSETLELPIQDAYSEFGRLAFSLNTARSAAEIADIRQQVEAASKKLRDGIPVRYVPADKAQDYQAERDDVSSQTDQLVEQAAPDESEYDVALQSLEDWLEMKNRELRNTARHPIGCIEFGAEICAPMLRFSPEHDAQVHSPVVQITGQIDRNFLDYNNHIILTIQDQEQLVSVLSDGTFQSKIVLGRGQNKVSAKLLLLNMEDRELFLTSRNISYEGAATKLRVTLVWDTAGSDLDLYVENSTEGTVSYNDKRSGNLVLDVDDTDGHGPENVSAVSLAAASSTKIRVQNYGHGVGTSATVYVYVNEQLFRTYSHTFSRSKEFWHVVELPAE